MKSTFLLDVVYTVAALSCWAGACVHQAQARLALQKAAHLHSELLALLQRYFGDLASFDTMLTDMLAIVKSFLGAMRSSFYLMDPTQLGGHLYADMWDDGWPAEHTAMPRKKLKIDLSEERSPAGEVARTGKSLNVHDAYKDPRFSREVDPTTGAIVRTALVAPVKGKNGIVGIVQVINKSNAQHFNDEDEKIFNVFVGYCSLIVHFANMQRRKIYHNNLNTVYGELMSLHVAPCRHDFEDLMETGRIIPPINFRSYDYHISEGNREDMPALVCHMFTDTFATERLFDNTHLADFVLTVLGCYRPNPYHNAEHAFCFTHTMYLILSSNTGYFDFVEDKKLLSKLPALDRDRILEEIRYDIMCTDLAVYFQVRAQLTPVLAERSFDWTDTSHRSMLKGILMTTCDLSGCCKPFGIAKEIAESVYAEFYAQGDKERALGYTPLSMMDRRRRANQPPEQIQFLSVVVLPCLALLQNVFADTAQLATNCRKTQDAWREEIEMRGKKLWKQEESVPNPKSATS